MSAQMQYTPGPWSITDSSVGGWVGGNKQFSATVAASIGTGVYRKVDGDFVETLRYRSVALVVGTNDGECPPSIQMANANAHLIAAAPDLLEALLPIGAAYPNDPGTSDLYDEQPVTIKLGDVRRAWRAIAKATRP